MHLGYMPRLRVLHFAGVAWEDGYPGQTQGLDGCALRTMEVVSGNGALGVWLRLEVVAESYTLDYHDWMKAWRRGGQGWGEGLVVGGVHWGMGERSILDKYVVWDAWLEGQLDGE